MARRVSERRSCARRQSALAPAAAESTGLAGFADSGSVLDGLEGLRPFGPGCAAVRSGRQRPLAWRRDPQARHSELARIAAGAAMVGRGIG